MEFCALDSGFLPSKLLCSVDRPAHGLTRIEIIVEMPSFDPHEFIISAIRACYRSLTEAVNGQRNWPLLAGSLICSDSTKTICQTNGVAKNRTANIKK